MMAASRTARPCETLRRRWDEGIPDEESGGTAGGGGRPTERGAQVGKRNENVVFHSQHVSAVNAYCHCTW